MVFSVSLALIPLIRLPEHSHMLIFGKDIAHPCLSLNEDVHPRPVDGFIQSQIRISLSSLTLFQPRRPRMVKSCPSQSASLSRV